MCGKLYVCGTPIGNLSDMSPRAVDTLKKVDFIAAEDTRVSMKLLNKFDIKTPMVSFHQHNERERGPEIIRRLQSGETAALVTDAGMPAISDPGEHLIALCHAAGVAVESVPGPTAFATAVALSGLYTGRFAFEGFLSTNKTSRREHLEEIKNYRETLVFYEAPHKLAATLKDMLSVFGDRRVSVVKELTKLHESAYITTLSLAAQYYAENKPKGEYVLVIEGAKKEEKTLDLDQAVKLAKSLKNGGMSASDAAKEAAAQSGCKKSEIYRRLV